MSSSPPIRNPAQQLPGDMQRRVKHYVLLILLTLAMVLPGLASVPVIDRDEARYTQASIQMVESGDYVSIRFQDEVRNKKPAGIYWMQSAALKLFSEPAKRQIWVQRLPSVIGALLAVLATYWGGRLLIGRQGGFYAGVLLALTSSLVFEAHIAKTDAMLCGLAALTLACLARLRHGGQSTRPYLHLYIAGLFWFALALGVLIKGPILPAIAALTLLTLWIWERDMGWAKPLRHPSGPILFLVLVLPWFILIGLATDGAFFTESIGGDFGSKLVAAQETHGGPPGYYLTTLWIMFWPVSLLLPIGVTMWVRTLWRRNAKPSDEPLMRAMRLLTAWTVPVWIILELAPTKLPHYTLPLYPALAILCATAILALWVSKSSDTAKTKAFPVSRRLGAILYVLVAIIICVAAMAAITLYGADPEKTDPATFSHYTESKIIYFSASVCLLIAIMAGGAFWSGRIKFALISAGVSTIMLNALVYHLLLPALHTVRISDQVVNQFSKAGIPLPRLSGPHVLSPTFTEPSLIYHLGQSVRLGGQVRFEADSPIKDGTVLLLDKESASTAEIERKARVIADGQATCWNEKGRIKGLNYAKGDPVDIYILRLETCPDTEPISTVESNGQ